MKFHFGLRTRFKKWLNRRRLLAIHHEFREYTMTPDWLFADTLEVTEKVRSLPGCVVECGVWRGGMIAGMARLLGPERKYHLFDSFEGLPPARDIDGEKAVQWQNDPSGRDYNDNCAVDSDYARRAMETSGVPSFTLVKGWFEKTLPSYDFGEPIAVLRLDGDWYESMLTCLNELFDRVAPGGLILIDDYYVWDGCSRAVHDFLSQRKAAERIQAVGKLVYIEKLPPPVSEPNR
jgi:O-methyltransferase